jgi:hypothetical protein
MVYILGLRLREVYCYFFWGVIVCFDFRVRMIPGHDRNDEWSRLTEGETGVQGLDSGKIEKSKECSWNKKGEFGFRFEYSDGSKGEEVGEGDDCREEIARLALEILKVKADEEDGCEE